jgi:colanic acid biosynthesis glycosyl transferase WcaI
MRVLILGLNYFPESTSIGPYTADLAEGLQARGHDVRVITGFPAAPEWKVFPEYEGKLFMREVIHDVPVVRTYLYVPKDPRRTSRRILFDSSFAISALAGVLTLWRSELVVVISPPLQLALTGLAIGAVSRAPVFLHIQDLVPDAALATGALRPGSAAARAAGALERFVYRQSRGIGVICEGMRRNLLAKGVPPDKVVTLPNYIDVGPHRLVPTDEGIRSRFGIDSRQFLVMYSGSVAGKQGLHTFVEAAAHLEQDDDITCCLIGAGAFLPELKLRAADLSLPRFQFIPLQPRENLTSQLAAADVLVITQRKAVRDMVFPGKLLYYMAAGRPVLAAVTEDSETGRFILERRVGMVVPPEEPRCLADAIRWMRAHPQEIAEWGRNGRLVVETEFDRTVVLDRISKYLETGLRNPKVPSGDLPLPTRE